MKKDARLVARTTSMLLEKFDRMAVAEGMTHADALNEAARQWIERKERAKIRRASRRRLKRAS